MALCEGCLAEDGAGRLFRLMLEEQKRYVASGHIHELVTPQPTGHTKTIDHVIIPLSCAESITRATTLTASGRVLQHAKVRRPLDFMILFWSSVEYAPP